MNNYKELIERLREYAEWARANEWEVPLCMGDSLEEAADAIENLTAELAEERHRHDRLQDWDRGMTEKLEQAQKRIAELEQELERVKGEPGV